MTPINHPGESESTEDLPLGAELWRRTHVVTTDAIKLLAAAQDTSDPKERRALIDAARAALILHVDEACAIQRIIGKE